MAKNSVSSLLTSVDSLFTTQAERDEAKRESVMKIPLEEISDFPNHPFKVRQDESMMELVESVKTYGVLVPGLVRPKEDGGYEMVAGHRRKLASQLAGQAEMDCIVRELTDDEATIIMVDSNLQREQLLPSEKAFAYKMKLDAMKRQGQRTDLTLSPVATKLDTAKTLGQQAGESRDQVFRYHDLPDAQAKALLKSPSPLADVFKDWEKKETGHMEDIWQTVEDRAKEAVKKETKKEQKER